MRIFVKAFLAFLLSLYLLILTHQILFKYLPVEEIMNHLTFNTKEVYWDSSNFIPFKPIFYYLFFADINLNIRIENIVGNIIGFVPLGFLLPLLLKKFSSLKAIAVTTFCISLTYEMIQLIFLKRGVVPDANL